MKRFLLFILMFALLLTPVSASGEETKTVAVAVDDLPAVSAILIDLERGTVLFEKNADARLAPASVTKIMTMLLVSLAVNEGKISFSDVVTASEHACSMGGSQIYLKVGEQMTVEDLFKSVAIASANDAAVALAEFVGGSEDVFVAMMNQKAVELGMVNTCFKNACGLDEDGHYTSARDIAIMSRAFSALPQAHLYATTWMDSVRNGAFELVNTNKLVRLYNGITGLKTGSTGKAKFCLSATAERDGRNLCAVVMACETADLRFQSAQTLLDHGFAAFEQIELAHGIELSDLPVLGGETESLTPVLSQSGKVLIPRGGAERVERIVSISDSLCAPISEGQKIGEVTVRLDGEVLGRVDIVASCGVEKLSFFKAFCRLIRAFGPF